MGTVQPSHFQAKWDSTNSHLKTPDRNLCQKIARVVWNIISVIIPIIGLIRLIGYGIGRLVNRFFILPSAHIRSKEAERDGFYSVWYGYHRKFNHLYETFSPSSHQVQTPDGAKLDATYFRHRDTDANTPTTIYFQPNATFSARSTTYEWLLEESMGQNKPMNFAIFDYRSVGKSKGAFNGTKDLTVDGSSIVQWVRDGLQVPPHLIHFYGYSLGGAVAISTKALDQKLTGKLVNERSFASVDAVSQAIINGFPCCLRSLAPLFVYAAKAQGYDMNVVSDFKKIQGDKLVVYHPEEWFQVQGRLFTHIQDTTHTAVKLKGNESAWDHHCEHLSNYDKAVPQITHFLFDKPVPAKDIIA